VALNTTLITKQIDQYTVVQTISYKATLSAMKKRSSTNKLYKEQGALVEVRWANL
jgi:hypothetical protein